MSNSICIPLNFLVFFSQNSHGFINIHEYYDMIICIFDHLVNRLCVSLNSKASLVL